MTEITENSACLCFRSQSIANVTLHVLSTPTKISLQNKYTEVDLNICFGVTIRPIHSSDKVGEYFPKLIFTHPFIGDI